MGDFHFISPSNSGGSYYGTGLVFCVVELNGNVHYSHASYETYATNPRGVFCGVNITHYNEFSYSSAPSLNWLTSPGCTLG